MEWITLTSYGILYKSIQQQDYSKINLFHEYAQNQEREQRGELITFLFIYHHSPHLITFLHMFITLITFVPFLSTHYNTLHTTHFPSHSLHFHPYIHLSLYVSYFFHTLYIFVYISNPLLHYPTHYYPYKSIQL